MCSFLKLLLCLYVNLFSTQEFCHLWLLILFYTWVEFDILHCREVLVVFGTPDWVCWYVTEDFCRLPWFLEFIHREKLLLLLIWTVIEYFWLRYLFGGLFVVQVSSFRFIYLCRYLLLFSLRSQISRLILVRFSVLFHRLWILLLHFAVFVFSGEVLGFWRWLCFSCWPILLRKMIIDSSGFILMLLDWK